MSVFGAYSPLSVWFLLDQSHGGHLNAAAFQGSNHPDFLAGVGFCFDLVTERIDSLANLIDQHKFSPHLNASQRALSGGRSAHQVMQPAGTIADTADQSASTRRSVEKCRGGGCAQKRDAQKKDEISHGPPPRSEEHTSELQSRGHLVCR